MKQAAEKWGISDSRIRALCADGKIPGAHREGRAWKIPADAAKPEDGRRRSRENILLQIDRKKKELDSCRPLMKDHMEAVGHKEAFDFVSQLVKDKVPMSKSVIKQIHYLVLADKNQDRGVYRRVPVCIMGAQHGRCSRI